MGLPRCFFDLSADNQPLGRIIIELRTDVTQKHVENFRALHRRERASASKGFTFHRVIRTLCTRVATSRRTIMEPEASPSGNKFEDENFILKHTGPGGIMSMASTPDPHHQRIPVLHYHREEPPGWTTVTVVFGAIVVRAWMWSEKADLMATSRKNLIVLNHR
ncbi:hypothetical protein quinque_014043 [Culex quinquefasciatus]